MSEDYQGHNDHKQEKNEACLIIVTPQGEWNHTFPKTEKISTVVKSVIDKFSFASNGTYELRLESDPTEPLKQDRTLVSYGLADEECHRVVFTDLGIAA